MIKKILNYFRNRKSKKQLDRFKDLRASTTTNELINRGGYKQGNAYEKLVNMCIQLAEHQAEEEIMYIKKDFHDQLPKHILDLMKKSSHLDIIIVEDKALHETINCILVKKNPHITIPKMNKESKS